MSSSRSWNLKENSIFGCGNELKFAHIIGWQDATIACPNNGDHLDTNTFLPFAEEGDGSGVPQSNPRFTNRKCQLLPILSHLFFCRNGIQIPMCDLPASIATVVDDSTSVRGEPPAAPRRTTKRRGCGSAAEPAYTSQTIALHHCTARTRRHTRFVVSVLLFCSVGSVRFGAVLFCSVSDRRGKPSQTNTRRQTPCAMAKPQHSSGIGR